MKDSKKIINYPVNYYSCQVVVNKRLFTELVISQYYKTKPGRSTVNDEVIRELVKQLNNDRFKRSENGYYDYEPLYIDYRAYKLVWDYDDEEKLINTILIIDCYRERKFDLK